MAITFFSSLDYTWNEYSSLRRKYSDGIPIPQKNYFSPISSIDDLATEITRLIEKPLWLGVHTLGFLIKAALSITATVILAPCALALAVIAPTSNLSRETSSAFKLCATHSLVSTGMAAIALIATALSLLFNPLHLITRAASSVVDSINSTTESCCDLTIARLR